MSTGDIFQSFRTVRQRLQEALQSLAIIAERHQVVVKGDTADLESNYTTNRALTDLIRQAAIRLDKPFRIAVVGEFSRGKSTFINVLMGREILASDYRPNTAAQTILRFGIPERFTVTFSPKLERSPETYYNDHFKDKLPQFISDAAVGKSDCVETYCSLLKGERKSLAEQVEQVEIYLDSHFLRQMQIELVDTPGLGSVFEEHGPVTLSAVRDSEALLFVVQVDPGIGWNEIAFLRLAYKYVPKIFLIVNKIDQVPSQELHSRIEYIRTTVQLKAKIDIENILPISAQLAATGNIAGSGIPAFFPMLENFLARSSGLKRLSDALHLLSLYTNQVLTLVEDNLYHAHQAHQEVEGTIITLEVEVSHIYAKHRSLMEYVKNSIILIRQNAINDIYTLPDKIRKKTEGQLALLCAEELRGPDYRLEIGIIKSVTNWLDEHIDGFVSELKSLIWMTGYYGEISPDSENFDENQIELIHAIEKKNSLGIRRDQYRYNVGKQITQILNSMELSRRLASLQGTLMLGGASIWNISRGSFARLLGGEQGQRNDYSEKLRLWIAETLLNEVHGSTVNAYQAVVEGYTKNYRKTYGIRQIVERTFLDWGNILDQNISELIDNNLDIALLGLKVKIKDKRQKLEKIASGIRELESEEKLLRSILKDILIAENFFPSQLLPEDVGEEDSRERNT